MPSAPTEAIIALSILFLAAEIVHKRNGVIGMTERYPWVIAFIFGLFHGLGFAGALSEIGVPQHEVPLALFIFNVGVETGQLLFIAGGARPDGVAETPADHGTARRLAFAALQHRRCGRVLDHRSGDLVSADCVVTGQEYGDSLPISLAGIRGRVGIRGQFTYFEFGDSLPISSATTIIAGDLGEIGKLSPNSG